MRRWLTVVAFVGLVAPWALAAPDGQEGEKGKGRGGEAGKPDDGKPEAAKGDEKGGQEKRLAEVDRRMQDEIDKHAERLAKIERLSELVNSKKDDKAAADLAHLREKEDARHAKAMRMIEQQRARVLEGKDGDSDDEKDKDKAKGEDKGRGKDDQGKEAPKDKGEEKSEEKDKGKGKDKEKDGGHGKGGK